MYVSLFKFWLNQWIYKYIYNLYTNIFLICYEIKNTKDIYNLLLNKYKRYGFVTEHYLVQNECLDDFTYLREIFFNWHFIWHGLPLFKVNRKLRS